MAVMLADGGHSGGKPDAKDNHGLCLVAPVKFLEVQ
jgi:hypothetical protein